ncbi:Gfo/Idh/MocA family protein [Blastopirellula marina]|uniref:Probable oxidoreductase n=1 Tax=Blastopirellula marina DSM 3645 TaxID=314230 RepID=A3ZQ35_9BACT|nr:Gfo/Idh/MocA family oxidoreductase [Blastopirellula marina]EAQ81308.1 probable oxidoreductase [Blastopirellula marina DSM 3645]
MPNENSTPNSDTRREFLRKSAAISGAAAVGSLSLARSVHAAGDDTIKVALIGCGGRGSGAAKNATMGDPNLKVTALCDIFPDVLTQARERLTRALGDRLEVTDETCFSGFDGYKQVMETDVDAVLLCTPPHFRPAHLRAAIEAGKHVFCEKPVAVDGPGCRHVFETVEMARQKDLSIVSGLCWRYAPMVQETIAKIKEGAIGDIVSIHETYLTGTLWYRQPTSEWTEMENQVRNWTYYTWLAGDIIAEQHIHSLDKALWLNDDAAPLACEAVGGRQVRTEAKWGNVYDHFGVSYEFPNDVKTFSYCRQMAGCYNDVNDYVYGTKGKAQILSGTVTPNEGEAWKYSGPGGSMYDLEHKALYEGMRSGNIINNGVYMTRSTLMAIMGRMAAYTGQKITWDMALNSQEDMTPKAYEWGDAPTPVVAMPGKTKFV